MNELKDIISVTKFKTNVVMILDCCNSGVATQGDKAVYTLTNFRRSIGEYTKRTRLLGTGRIVFASSRASQSSKELTDCMHGHPHGKFTYHLLEGIDGKAADEKTGIINFDKLQKYIFNGLKAISSNSLNYFLLRGTAWKI